MTVGSFSFEHWMWLTREEPEPINSQDESYTDEKPPKPEFQETIAGPASGGRNDIHFNGLCPF